MKDKKSYILDKLIEMKESPDEKYPLRHGRYTQFYDEWSQHMLLSEDKGNGDYDNTRVE